MMCGIQKEKKERKKHKMISVIVPVYNVEPYLRKCLDSIINQTYRDLEILVVDDGSTDGSGKICDEYVKQDERIQVFHTENKGLSPARNLGLDKATGDWIGFVDSDDWIEPDMYESLLKRAEETGADVVECGYCSDYMTVSIRCIAFQGTASGAEALEALIRNEILTQVWNKIWSHHLFTGIRFPEGRSFEDVATTYKLIQDAMITGIPGNFYHWRQRKSSISHSHDQKNLIDYWIAHKQRYENMKDCVNEETVKALLKSNAYAITRTWVWNYKSRCPSEHINEMSDFARKHFPVFGFSDWPMNLRLGIFLVRFNNMMSFMAAYLLNQAYRSMKPQYYQ